MKIVLTVLGLFLLMFAADANAWCVKCENYTCWMTSLEAGADAGCSPDLFKSWRLESVQIAYRPLPSNRFVQTPRAKPLRVAAVLPLKSQS